jgi:hypothetical protein
MNMEQYYKDLLKRVSKTFSIPYDDLMKKVPFDTNKKSKFPSYDDYLIENSSKSLKELQMMAMEYGCSKSGKKEQIIKRLYEIISIQHKNNINEVIEDNTNEETEEVNIKIPKSALYIDVCVGTDDIVEEKQPESPKSNNKTFNKWFDITDKDLLLLLQTHHLSLDGTRNDLIERLKNFYKEAKDKNQDSDAIREHILDAIQDDDYVSRVEVNGQFINIISTGIYIGLTDDNRWYKKDNNDMLEVRHILIPNKRWIFKETDISYEFIGVANDDHTFILCDIPDELMMITEKI